jgi:hypothetical protein
MMRQIYSAIDLQCDKFAMQREPLRSNDKDDVVKMTQ